MYNLPYHKEKDPQIIKEFIDRYPFAFITGCDAGNKPFATQIPLYIEEKNGTQFLRGHIMAGTDHHKAFLENSNVLVVFTGHHTYVSGTWYSNPYIPSTWNYMSVHIKGNLRFTDEKELEDILRVTSLHFEKNNLQSTTIYDNLPDAFKQRVMHMIAGFEIEIKEIDNIFKLSQDRDFKSYQNIIEKLRQQDESGKVIAAEMEKRTSQVFPEVSL